MLIDLDRYYTPNDVAERLLADSVSLPPKSCVDSTCGSGRLLHAANQVFGDVQCIGIDRDRKAIASLKRRNPDWILSVADLLNPISYKKTLALSESRDCDLLVLNPPFSHGNRKSVDIVYNGQNLKSSIAMAHILQSFELFKPNQGAVIIVPESVLYSETDTDARSILTQDYDIEKITELESSTFSGTRAHATVIKVTPGNDKQHNVIHELVPSTKLKAKLIRGGLPVHEMEKSRSGVPYIHSTDIRELIQEISLSRFTVTRSIRRGRISGWVILLPRVGMPERSIFKAIYLQEEIQLSDCVIALVCTSNSQAEKIEKRINLHWDSFVSLYRGTGARYTTISRLHEWLRMKNIVLQNE